MAKSHYCQSCKRLLFKGDLADVEIVCHRCKHKNEVRYISQSILTRFIASPTVEANNQE